ncbi:hypothetical protein CK203_045715 [Vitis vinifera]|uniref:Uncharacterized protein n=1 Tax=Vitis vinifera TaxID=29760 RepID=A0A438I0Y9_VITVI|nr:hypothetical protein CK203_045715 [Vitis vinifera]
MVFSSTFRVIIIISQLRRSESSSLLGFGVQSHHCVFSFGVQSHYRFQLNIQSHHHHFLAPAFRVIITFRVASSVSTFRVVITSQFDVHGHRHYFLVSAFRAIIEPSSLFSLAFKAIIAFSFGVQSHHYFQFWRSEPSSLFSFGVQSHHYFQFGVQSHHHYFQFWRSEPSSLFSFGVQSHHYFQFWRSEPSSLFSFGVQSITIFSLAFRAIITIFSVAFRAIIASQFWRSKPSLFSVLAFRAIITIFSWRSEPSSLFFQCGIQSHHRFSSFYFLSLVLRVGLVIQSHNSWRSCPLALRILPSGFCIRPRLSSLRYPVLIAYSSRSPHRIVPFGRILARTPGWFDRYSSLTLISWAADGGWLGQRSVADGKGSREACGEAKGS